MWAVGMVLLILAALAYWLDCEQKEQERQRQWDRWLYEHRRSPGVADHD